MVEPTPHTFDEAQLQIYTLMHRDSYPRFVNSAMYKSMAQQTGAETESDTPHGQEFLNKNSKRPKKTAPSPTSRPEVDVQNAQCTHTIVFPLAKRHCDMTITRAAPRRTAYAHSTIRCEDNRRAFAEKFNSSERTFRIIPCQQTSNKTTDYLHLYNHTHDVMFKTVYYFVTTCIFISATCLHQICLIFGLAHIY